MGTKGTAKSMALVILTLLALPLRAQDLLPPSDPKFLAARAVYQKLVDSSGSAQIPPRFVMIRGEPQNPGELAFYDGETKVVRFSEFVYDQCAELAGPSHTVPDCLSALLGHELAHFYKDHTWSMDVLPARGMVARDLGLALEATPVQVAAKRREQEAQADHAGGILAYQAGFDPTAHWAALLDRLYNHYQSLQQKHPDYPLLDERKQILQDTSRDLTGRLFPAFEAGVRLFVLGEYGLAAECFDFVGHTFTSREIFNNAAAAYILAAIQADPSLAGGYVYPVELDLETRLNPRRGTAKSLDDYLGLAVDRLRAALKLDPDYAPALINLAIAASLTGDAQEAQRLALRVEKGSGPNAGSFATQASILRAITLARAGQKARAARLLDGLAKSGNKLAQLDRRVLNGEKLDAIQPPVYSKVSSAETIAGLTLSEIQSMGSPSPQRIRLREEGMRNEPAVLLEVNTTPQYRAYAILINRSRLASLAAAPAGCTGTFLGNFKAGSDVAEVVKGHPPVRRYSAPQGTYLVFADPALLVFANGAGKVVDWTLYNVSQMESTP